MINLCIIHSILNPRQQVPSRDQPLRKRSTLNCPLFMRNLNAHRMRYSTLKSYRILTIRVAPMLPNVCLFLHMNVYGGLLTGSCLVGISSVSSITTHQVSQSDLHSEPIVSTKRGRRKRAQCIEASESIADPEPGESTSETRNAAAKSKRGRKALPSTPTGELYEWQYKSVLNCPIYRDSDAISTPNPTCN